MSQLQTSLTPPDPPSPSARVTRSADCKGLHVVVTATRRITGVTVVVTQVSGGPDNLRRDFYTVTPEPDPARACAEAIEALTRLLDEEAPRANGVV